MGLSPRHTKASEVFKLQVQDSQTARAGLIQTFSPTLTLKHLGISPGSHAPTWSSLSIQCLLQLVPKPHSQFYQLLVLLPRADDIFHLSERMLGKGTTMVEDKWPKETRDAGISDLLFYQSRQTMTEQTDNDSDESSWMKKGWNIGNEILGAWKLKRVKGKKVFHYALLVLLCAKTRSELNTDLWLFIK